MGATAKELSAPIFGGLPGFAKRGLAGWPTHSRFSSWQYCEKAGPTLHWSVVPTRRKLRRVGQPHRGSAKSYEFVWAPATVLNITSVILPSSTGLEMILCRTGDEVTARNFGTFLTIVIFLPVIVSAQYGTTPNNYYPASYNGSIFRGVVADTAENQITLTFTKDSKRDSFTGLFETGCSVPTTEGRRVMPGDIPKGTTMTVFFNSKTKKVDGKRVKENVIIAIAFEVWQGQKVAEEKKKMYWCTDNRYLQFRSW
jgi:hypothetical protein